MRPDKTNPCMADQTRKQQARSELIQTNQNKAYQDQSRTEQTDSAAARHRGQTKLDGALVTSNSRQIRWSSAAAHDSTTQTQFPKAAAGNGQIKLESWSQQPSSSRPTIPRSMRMWSSSSTARPRLGRPALRLSTSTGTPSGLGSRTQPSSLL